MGEKLEESDLLKELVSRYENKIGNFDKIQDLFENHKKYNPWNTEKTSELSKEFFAALKNEDKDFSWLNVDDKLHTLPSHDISIDYGIPSHVRGDIENGTLFLCLVNPNIQYKGSKHIYSFYDEARKIESDDKSLKVLDENGDISITEQEISSYIINTDSESSILLNELKCLRSKMEKNKKTPKKDYGYYLSRYFPQIIISYMDKEKSIQPLMKNLSDAEWNKLEKMSKKIVDLEAFPFRSKLPGFSKTLDINNPSFADSIVDLNSNVSMLSARIIIWRIVKYFKDIDEDINTTRPRFVFRRFNTAWLPSLINVLQDDLSYTKDDSLKLINKLHEDFFLTIDEKSSNMRRGYIGKRLFKNDTMLSDEEFDEFARETLK